MIITMMMFGMIFGCGSNKITLQNPDNPMVFTERDHESYDCIQLEYNGKTYVPYCAASPSMCDDVIGYYELKDQENAENQRVYVLSSKEWSSDEWIIECVGQEGDTVGGHNIGMLMREESVKNIPESLQGKSEYEWNKN